MRTTNCFYNYAILTRAHVSRTRTRLYRLPEGSSPAAIFPALGGPVLHHDLSAWNQHAGMYTRAVCYFKQIARLMKHPQPEFRRKRRVMCVCGCVCACGCSCVRVGLWVVFVLSECENTHQPSPSPVLQQRDKLHDEQGSDICGGRCVGDCLVQSRRKMMQII